MVGLKRRAASPSGAPLPTSRELERERRARLADADALEATEGGVVEAEAAREAIDPELDPETWHRTRAEREEAVVAAIRERDRLRASTENRRQRCKMLAEAIASQPIAEADATIKAAREQETIANAIATAARTTQARAERERVDAVEARAEALAEFDDAVGKRARFDAQQNQNTRIRGLARARIEGLPTVTPTAADERLIVAEVARLRAANDLVQQGDYAASDAARAAGITRLPAGGSAAPLSLEGERDRGFHRDRS